MSGSEEHGSPQRIKIVRGWYAWTPAYLTSLSHNLPATVCTHTHCPQGSRTHPEGSTPASGSSVLSADCLSIDFVQVVVREHIGQDLLCPPHPQKSTKTRIWQCHFSLLQTLHGPPMACGYKLCVVVEVATLPRQALPPVLYLLHSSWCACSLKGPPPPWSLPSWSCQSLRVSCIGPSSSGFPSSFWNTTRVPRTALGQTDGSECVWRGGVTGPLPLFSGSRFAFICHIFGIQVKLHLKMILLPGSRASLLGVLLVWAPISWVTADKLVNLSVPCFLLCKVEVEEYLFRDFLVVQWLRICRPMQRTWVWLLVWELRSQVP